MVQTDNMQEIMQLQEMHQQMEHLSKQLEELQEKQSTISITVNAIKELENTEPGTEILAPIADGIFVKTSLTKNSSAVVNIGKGVTVEKPLLEVVKMVQSHEANITSTITNLESQMQNISEKLLEKITVLEMNKNTDQPGHTI